MDMTRTVSAIRLQGVVKAIAKDVFEVESETDPTRSYIVTLPNGSCTCPDFQYRQAECKHQIAARLSAWRSGA